MNKQNSSTEYQNYVKNDKWKVFLKHRKVNSTHWYNMAVSIGEDIFLRYLSYGWFCKPSNWKEQSKMPVKECYDKTYEMIKSLGFSNSQDQFMVHNAIQFSPRGEEVRLWWNLKYAKNKEEAEAITKQKKTISSNMFYIKVKE